MDIEPKYGKDKESLSLIILGEKLKKRRRCNNKISGRNKIKGTVTKVTTGIVSSEVEIETPGGFTIAGLITKTSQEDLDIKVGDEITALIKATSVMFMKE